jgi:hypothetical protein
MAEIQKKSLRSVHSQPLHPTKLQTSLRNKPKDKFLNFLNSFAHLNLQHWSMPRVTATPRYSKPRQKSFRTATSLGKRWAVFWKHCQQTNWHFLDLGPIRKIWAKTEPPFARNSCLRKLQVQIKTQNRMAQQATSSARRPSSQPAIWTSKQVTLEYPSLKFKARHSATAIFLSNR